jgi:hypothetical protein
MAGAESVYVICTPDVPSIGPMDEGWVLQL